MFTAPELSQRVMLIFALLLCISLLFCGCGSKSSSGPDEPEGPEVIEKVTADVTSEGASLVLTNGITLAIPSGTVTGTVKVELSQLAGDTNFTADFQTLLDIEAHGAVSSASLRIPLTTGQDTNLVAAAYISSAGDRVDHLEGFFNSAADTFMVPLTASVTSSTSLNGGLSSGTVVVSRGASYSPITITHLMELPYYQQDGDNCWAACMNIFLRAYKNTSAFDKVHEILKYCGIGKNDGYGWYNMGSMKKRCESLAGLSAEKNTWICFDNFVGHIFKCIDENKPVLTNVITHQLVICGYEIQNPGPGEVISLYMHDPANWDPQTPYRKMTLDQIASTYWEAGIVYDLTNYFVTINFTTAMLSTPYLETIELMDADTTAAYLSTLGKGIAFGKDNDALNYVVWDHSKPEGYRIKAGDKVLPDMNRIRLSNIPVWNMDLYDAAAVRIKTSLYRYVDGVFKYPPMTEKSENRTIGAKSQYDYSMQFELADFADKIEQDDSLFAIEVQLFNSANTRVDGFDVIFEYHPLIILSLDPDSGDAGDDITIEGMGFGNSQGTSKLYFGTLEADVRSWTDKRIIAEVPAGVSDCDVTVKVKNVVSNKMPFHTQGNFLELLQATTWINIRIEGLHTYIPGSTAIPLPITFSWEELEWNGTSFTVDYDYYGAEYTLNGTVSSDGKTVESVDAYYNNHNTDLNYIVHFILDDIPVTPGYSPQEDVFFQMDITSANKNDHIIYIQESKKYEDGSDYFTYVSTDWNSSSNPPRVKINFYKSSK